jgi:HJR/Mrr/RecB family endonuclease
LDIDLNFSDIFSAFLSVGPLIFPFWPVIIVAAFINRKKRFSPDMAIVLWLPFFIWRIDMFVNVEQPAPVLLQEPLNTISFFIVGFLIIGTGSFRSYRKARRIRRARSVEKLLELSPAEFEQAVGEMFKSSGYKVTHRGKSGDHGVDLVVRSKKAGKWIVQCKQRKGLVGEPILRDIYGAMHHEKADGAAVVTTGRFSRPAIAWAEDKPIDLYDGDRLTELLQKRK